MSPAEEQSPLESLDTLLSPPRWSASECQVRQAIAEIPDEETRAKFTAACNDLAVPPNNIAKAFRQVIGATPKDGTIRRHQGRNDPDRTARCSCP